MFFEFAASEPTTFQLAFNGFTGLKGGKQKMG